MADRVRSHTRRTASGTQRVKQHSRRSRGRKGKPLLSPRHAWALVKRAARANKRKKRLLAGTLLGLGAAEGVAWATVSGTRLVLFTAGFLAIGAAMGFGMLTGHGG